MCVHESVGLISTEHEEFGAALTPFYYCRERTGKEKRIQIFTHIEKRYQVTEMNEYNSI